MWASLAGGLFAMMSLRGLLSLLYPMYNFCWGGYRCQYERCQKRRYFLFVSVLAALAVSIAAGLVVKFVAT